MCLLRGLNSTSAFTAGKNCGNHLNGENAIYMYNNLNIWCPIGIFIFRFHMQRVISGMKSTREKVSAIPCMPYKHEGVFGMNFPFLWKLWSPVVAKALAAAKSLTWCC